MLLPYWGRDQEKEAYFISLDMGSFVFHTYEMLISQNQIMRQGNIGGPGAPEVAVRCHADGTSREASKRNVNVAHRGLNLKTQKPPSVA